MTSFSEQTYLYRYCINIVLLAPVLLVIRRTQRSLIATVPNFKAIPYLANDLGMIVTCL